MACRAAGALGAAVLAATPLAARQLPFLDGEAVGALAGADSIVAGDFDQDGDLDLAAAERATDQIVWLEDTGAGFVEHPVVSTFDQPVDLEPADIDCDGDLDLVIAVAGTGDVVWARNVNQASSWNLGGTISSTAPGILSVAAADLSGNGAPDVVGGGNGADELVVWTHPDCSSAVWNPTVVSSALTSVRDVAVADVDRDGRLDLVTASTADDLVAVWENDGGGAFTRVDVDTAFDGAFSVSVGDVDRDGDPDVAAAANAGGELAWWANPGGAGVWAKTPIASLAGARVAQLADVDGDGDLDLAGASGSGPELSWWDNTAGDGSAWSPQQLDPAPASPRDLVVADLGPDGDADVAAAALTAGVRFYANDSTGRNANLDLSLWLFYPFISGDLVDLETADLDGDGLLDVVGIWQGPQPSDTLVDWFAGVGADEVVGILTFAFNVGEIYHSVIDFLESLALGDVDSDGDTDVVIGQQTSISANAYNLCLNDGAGASWTCFDITSGFNADWRVDALELADVDADGDLDLLAVAEETLNGVHSVLWLENSGDPTDPVDWLRHVIAADGPYDDLVVVDLDRDADLDVLAAGGNWWRNDGGSPPVWSAQSIPLLIGSPAVDDVDGDGDLDVASARFDGSLGISWFENDLAGTWAEHEIFPPVIEDAPGASYALADLDRDGDPDLLAHMVETTANGESRVSWFENEVAAGGDPWVEREIEPPGTPASHLLVADFDREGDADVLIADVFGNGEWQSWVNAGGQFGLPTAVVGPANIAEGVERALLTIDAFHRGRPGEEAIDLAAVSLLFEEETGGNPVPLTQQQFDDLIEAVRLYRDDGSGTFVPGQDEEVGEFDALALTDGEALLELADDVPALQHVPEETPATYFVTVELTATAAAAGVATVTVTHTPGVPNTHLDELPQAPSAAENAAFDVPLLQELSLPAAATFDVLESEIFEDGFESGDTSAWAQTVPFGSLSSGRPGPRKARR